MERGNPPQAGRMQGARPFGYFWGNCQKWPAVRAEPLAENNTKAAYVRRLKLSHTLNLHASKQRIPGNAVPRNKLLVIMLKHLHRKIRLQQRL